MVYAIVIFSCVRLTILPPTQGSVAPCSLRVVVLQDRRGDHLFISQGECKKLPLAGAFAFKPYLIVILHKYVASMRRESCSDDTSSIAFVP